MLSYTINKAHIAELAAEELSHVADKAYTEQGISLYDGVILTSKDDNLVDRFLEDAVNALAGRAFDICYRTTDGLNFDVPDFDETMEGAVFSEITRYLSLYIVASFAAQRSIPDYKEYSERAKAAQDKAIILLKSRKLPV